MTIKRIFAIGIAVSFFTALGAWGGVLWGRFDAAQLATRVTALERELGLQGQELTETSEIARRAAVREKSQDELLTEAVAEVAPSVVSIVVSKDVPKLRVEYVNPFGNDPFFRDFNIRVPRYVQEGTETQKVGAGTGFFISSSGHIATNRHVVEDAVATYTALLTDGRQLPATVVYRDDAIDFAVLKVSGSGFAPAALGNSAGLKLGQTVFAVGNALGEFSNSISVGIVSGLNRSLEAESRSGTESLENVIQTDAAINPGNSGGPLVDLDGRVVGINVATVVGGQSIGFAVPVDTVKKLITAVASGQ